MGSSATALAGGSGQESAALAAQVFDVSSACVMSPGSAGAACAAACSSQPLATVSAGGGGEGHPSVMAPGKSPGSSSLAGRRRVRIILGWLTVARVAWKSKAARGAEFRAWPCGRTAVGTALHHTLPSSQDPSHAHAAARGRPIAPHGTSRFAGREHAGAPVGLAGTRRRCDNPSLTEPDGSETGVGQR